MLTSGKLAPHFGSPGVSDLSTILEAETSGISRHLPDLDDSKDASSWRAGRSPRPSPSPKIEDGVSDIQDTSALNLSTSELNKEVLAALSQSGPRGGWTSGVVVDDEGGAVDANVTFNLGSVDPDLAALLSPNHMKATEPALLVAINALSPPLRSPTDTRPNSPASPRHAGSSNEKTPPPFGRRSTSLPRPTVINRSPSDKSSALGSRLPVQSTSPRLARSASERPSYSGPERPHIPSTLRTPESTGRQSLQLPRRRASPLLGESPLPPRPTSSDGQESSRGASSRLATPARHLLPASTSRTRLIPSPQSSPGYDGSESTSSRTPSAIGPAASRRLAGIRPSLDVGDRPRIYTRDRSSSLTEGSPYDPPAKRPVDWLGPRTAKAFAAAGLLDSERDASPGPSASRPGSRFGFGSSRSERDFRSHYAPSRAGFSDVGPSASASWARRSGSISRGSESLLGTPLSDSASTTPRTTYSAPSTAPTSVSASSAQRMLHEELSALQEKHTLETGALLSALADSQRTTKMLREENAQLRDRLHYAEDQLAAVREELHRVQFAQAFNPPSTSTLGRSSLSRLAAQTMPEPTRRRSPQSRLQTLLHSSADDFHADFHAVEETEVKIEPEDSIPARDYLHTTQSSQTLQRRKSGASSIFPAPPSNMTMLLHDDAGGPDYTSAPTPATRRSRTPSPTLVAGRPAPPASAHAAQYSVSSSAGNISPTTANFSIVTGSPGSLYLRPEHERLLGDMPTLDLHADEFAFDDLHHGL